MTDINLFEDCLREAYELVETKIDTMFFSKGVNLEDLNPELLNRIKAFARKYVESAIHSIHPYKKRVDGRLVSMSVEYYQYNVNGMVLFITKGAMVAVYVCKAEHLRANVEQMFSDFF